MLLTEAFKSMREGTVMGLCAAFAMLGGGRAAPAATSRRDLSARPSMPEWQENALESYRSTACEWWDQAQKAAEQGQHRNAALYAQFALERVDGLVQERFWAGHPQIERNEDPPAVTEEERAAVSREFFGGDDLQGFIVAQLKARTLYALAQAQYYREQRDRESVSFECQVLSEFLKQHGAGEDVESFIRGTLGIDPKTRGLTEFGVWQRLTAEEKRRRETQRDATAPEPLV
jgi:hypothetical protein